MGRKSDEQDSITTIVFFWFVSNVLAALFPWLLVILVKVVGGLEIKLLDITPDFLLIGFSVAYNIYSCVTELKFPPKKKHLYSLLPLLLLIICIGVYFALFGEFSFAVFFLSENASALPKFFVFITCFLIFNAICCSVLLYRQLKRDQAHICCKGKS